MIDTVQHTWIKQTVTPIHPLPGDDGPIIMVDPDEQESAENEAVYGCNVCDAMLTSETLESECPGPDPDEEI